MSERKFVVNSAQINAPMDYWNDPQAGFIYLIVTSEDPGVFKIGKTINDPQERYSKYKARNPGTDLQVYEFCRVAVKRMDVVERICIHELGKRFKRMAGGLEWFIGDETLIINLVSDICRKYALRTDIEIAPGFDKPPHWYEFYGELMDDTELFKKFEKKVKETSRCVEEAYNMYVAIVERRNYMSRPCTKSKFIKYITALFSETYIHAVIRAPAQSEVQVPELELDDVRADLERLALRHEPRPEHEHDPELEPGAPLIASS